MRFEARLFRLPKDPAASADYQDAYRMDAVRGVASVADGVSSALFSGPWAAILTEAIVADPPNPDDPEAFAAWLAVLRSQWASRIDISNLAWFQKAKLKQGAFATLVWICLFSRSEIDVAPDDPDAAYLCQAFAVGDSCLFHVRDDALLTSFPIQASAELEANPLAVGSMDLNRDQMLRFSRHDAWCRAGDLLVLCTDAMADWILRQYERGGSPDWQYLWAMTESQWQSQVLDLRTAQEMRYDDTTLLMLRVKTEQSAAAKPAAPVSFLGLEGFSPAAGPPGPIGQAPAAGPQPAMPEAASAAPLPEATPKDSTGWRVAEQFVSKSEEIAEQMTDGLLRGARKLKDRFFKKYRETFGRKDPPEGHSPSDK